MHYFIREEQLTRSRLYTEKRQAKRSKKSEKKEGDAEAEDSSGDNVGGSDASDAEEKGTDEDDASNEEGSPWICCDHCGQWILAKVSVFLPQKTNCIYTP